jgi:foldase protein PrsA
VRRIVLPLALAVLIALSLGLILGGVVASNAVVVDGANVSQSQASADLATASASPTYLCYLNASALVRSSGQTGLGSVTGSSRSSYSAVFATSWMNQKITSMIIADEVRRRGLSSQAQLVAERAKADLGSAINLTLSDVTGTQAQCKGSAAELLTSLPSSFSSWLVGTQADTEVLLAKLGGIGLDRASLQHFYDQAPSNFDSFCVSGILAASQDSATSLRTQILNGASFASVAAASSLDTTSKANGGAIGCFSPSSASYSSVLKDVGSLAVGQVTQPLASQNGQYVLLSVTSRSPTPFSTIVTEVRQAALAKDSSLAQGEIARLVQRASVDLNPRYGSWVATKAQTGVVPPDSPPSSAILNLSANQPGASG